MMMGKEWLGLAPSLAPSSCLYFRATCLISWHAYQEQDNQGDDFVQCGHRLTPCCDGNDG